MGVMYDAVNVNAIPAGATLVAGYVDGRYQTIPALRARFPAATIVEITVTGKPGVRVCDCETGDLTPRSAAGWARRELAAGRRPTIYCNTSTWPAVRAALGDRAGRVDWWVAHYDNSPAIPAGAVAKQYKNGSYDTSATVPGWPTAQPAPIPAPVLPPPVAAYKVGDLMLHPVTMTTDANGDGWMETDIPWSAFQGATIQKGYPPVDGYWRGEAGAQDRDNKVLVVVTGFLPRSVATVFVLASD